MKDFSLVIVRDDKHEDYVWQGAEEDEIEHVRLKQAFYWLHNRLYDDSVGSVKDTCNDHQDNANDYVRGRTFYRFLEPWSSSV